MGSCDLALQIGSPSQISANSMMCRRRNGHGILVPGIYDDGNLTLFEATWNQQ